MDPDPDPYPDSLEMLDPDSVNPGSTTQGIKRIFYYLRTARYVNFCPLG